MLKKYTKLNDSIHIGKGEYVADGEVPGFQSHALSSLRDGNEIKLTDFNASFILNILSMFVGCCSVWKMNETCDKIHSSSCFATLQSDCSVVLYFAVVPHMRQEAVHNMLCIYLYFKYM